MSKLLLSMLMMSLVSCRSEDLRLSFTGEQCSPVFSYVDETKKLIDVDKSYCNVRQYEMNINHVGALPGTDLKKPLPYCDRCTGFKKYADAATFWEKVRSAVVENANALFQGKVISSKI